MLLIESDNPAASRGFGRTPLMGILSGLPNFSEPQTPLMR